MSVRQAIFLCCLFVSATELVAQDALLLYHIEAVPKRLMLNPAAPVPHRAWLSLPGLGHVDQTLRLPWAVTDVADLRGTSLRQLINGTSPVAYDDLRIDVPAAIEGLTPMGRARVTTRVNLLSFGMQVPTGLLSLNIDQQLDGYAASGPGALAGIFYGEPYVLANGAEVRGVNYDVNTRTSYSLGYQFAPDRSPWRFGINVKAVKVQAHAHLRDLAIEVTSEGPKEVSVYYEGGSRIAGFADLIEGQSSAEDLTWRRAFEGGNWGLGVDLGAHYQASDRLQLSASLTDLGFARLGYQTREYAFFNTIRRGDSDPLASLERVTIARGVEEVEELSRSGRNEAINADPYTRPLPTSSYVGAEYHFAGRHSAGLVVRNSMRGGRLQTATAATLNLRPWRVFEASTSVAWSDGAGVGVGLAASFQLSVIQLYVGSDNLLALGSLDDARWANVFAGLTLLLPESRAERTARAKGARQGREPAIKCYKF